MDGIVAALIGVTGALLLNLIADLRGYKKISNKIGNHKSDTLEGQHDNIKDLIGGKVDNIERLQNSEFNRIFIKVDNIDKEMAASKESNKERYNNLNFDQKSIKDNVNKLIYDWERTNLENKELKGRITELEKRIGELEIENKELITSLNKSKRKNREIGL